MFCQLVLECRACGVRICARALACTHATYVSIFVEEVQSVQINSQDAGSLDGWRVRALNVEKGGAKHGEGTDQAWREKTQQSFSE